MGGCRLKQDERKKKRRQSLLTLLEFKVKSEEQVTWYAIGSGGSVGANRCWAASGILLLLLSIYLFFHPSFSLSRCTGLKGPINIFSGG